MITPPADEYGFKRITLDNWLKIDPVWNAFVMSAELSDPAEAWVNDLLKTNLGSAVPLPIRKLYETARGALVYGLMFYPLLTIGTEQIFRVYELAASIKCKALNAPDKKRVFADKIQWLSDHGAISPEDRPRWDAIRHLRNSTSHPEDQNIFPPGTTLNLLDGTVELIDRLFA